MDGQSNRGAKKTLFNNKEVNSLEFTVIISFLGVYWTKLSIKLLDLMEKSCTSMRITVAV